MPQTSLYDVIVVGSGPGGATAARRLALAGRRVLLLEGARLPRPKTCAGGVPRKAIEAIGFDVSDVYETATRRALITYRGQYPVEVHFDQPSGWTVMRSAFDQRLAQAAQAAGVTLIEGARVKGVQQAQDRVVVATDGQAYEGRYLIGADGANSLCARSLGLMPNRRNGIALEAEMPVSPAKLEEYRDTLVFDFGGVPNGYAWIFAKSDHLSVGVGKFDTQGSKRLREWLTDYAVRTGLMEPGQPITCPCKGHPIPLGGGRQPLHTGRALLVGDAAGLADPFLGEGIYYAIRSGQLGADAVDAALTSGASLAGYSRAVHTEIISDFVTAQRLAIVVYKMPWLAHWAFSRSDRLRAAMAHMLEGKLSWTHVWSHGLRALLPFLPPDRDLPPAPLDRQAA